MDFKSSLKFIAENYVLVTGSTLALFFATSMVLLIRSIGKKDEAQAAPALDVKEIEDAMQRVLAANPVPVAAAPAPAVVDAETVEEKTETETEPAAEVNQNLELIEAYKNKVNELEGRIEQLTRDLEQARSSARSRDENSVSKEDYDALQEKITELQARLAEYEIIEDDIADLSMYKEENARLKAEIARLKGGEPSAQAETSEPPEPQIVRPAPKPNRFELDVNDQIMKEFATAIEIRNAPPAEAQATLPTDLMNEEGMATELENQSSAPAPESTPAEAEPASGEFSVEAIAQEVEDAIASEAAAVEGVTQAQVQEEPVQEPAQDPSQPTDGTESAEAVQSSSDEASQVTDVTPVPEAPRVAEDKPATETVGPVDADKILNEMASLEEKDAGDLGDVLSDSLDTDKLLEEMNSLIADPNAGESQDTQKKAGTG